MLLDINMGCLDSDRREKVKAVSLLVYIPPLLSTMPYKHFLFAPMDLFQLSKFLYYFLIFVTY